MHTTQRVIRCRAKQSCPVDTRRVRDEMAGGLPLARREMADNVAAATRKQTMHDVVFEWARIRRRSVAWAG